MWSLFFATFLFVTVVGCKSLLNDLEWQDAVPDPHLEIRGRGGRSSRPLNKGVGGGDGLHHLDITYKNEIVEVKVTS